MESRNLCAICGSNSEYRCKACEKVYYCSKRHQKIDWKKHVEICKAYKLAENAILGRHYIATRNIKAGEIILKEDHPLIAGPMHNCVPVCLECYTVLNKDIAVPCMKCGWPLCQNCTTHGVECRFTALRRNCKVSITEFSYPHPSYECISVIRALSLKDTNPESYEKLMTLEDHCNQMQSRKGLDFADPLPIVNFFTRFFKVTDLPKEEIMKILCIFQINGFEVGLSGAKYIAVYDLASILEHNCKANCSKSFTDKGGVIIHAATPIAKGEHISICYTDPLWGTANRRHHLYETKFFECVCPRCTDTTEFGTYFSALKCREVNCSGYMLPTSFLNQEQKDYHCNTCGSIVSYEIIEHQLEEIGLYLSRLDKNDIAACKEFLYRNRHMLHANHFYNTEICFALCQLIAPEGENLTMIKEDLLIEKIELCRRLANLFKLLMPAENRSRGMILLELCSALRELSTRHTQRNAALSLLQEYMECLIDACQLLKYDPEELPEEKNMQIWYEKLGKIKQALKST